MSAGSEPRRFGEYETLFELASGGMATVLLARQLGDAGFERLVALKRIHPHLLSDPEVFAMASDEARLAALVRHPNVVSVAGVLDEGGELILVQEYVEGASLATLLKRMRAADRSLPLPVAVKIACDALRGLHAAHEVKDLRGEKLELVHRDVSPQNILVGADGTSRIIDFGIARAERRMALTKTGIVKGKVQYMSPEQLEEKALDRRTDVFALAAVLYEMVTGERPFPGTDETAIMARVLTGEVDLEPLDRAASSLTELVAGALSKDPSKRPKTALDLCRALAKAIPPADEEDVRALVDEVLGVELEDVRARVRSALGAIDEAPESVSDAVEIASAPVARRERSRRPLVIGAVVGAVSIAAVVAVASQSASSDRVSATSAAASSGAASASAVSSAPSTLVSSAPSVSARETALASVSARGSEVASASPSVSATGNASTGAGTARRSAVASASASVAPAHSAEDLFPSPYKK